MQVTLAMRIMALAVAVAVLAGCMAHPAASGDAGRRGRGGAEPTAREAPVHLEQTFALRFNEVKPGNHDGNNCVMLKGSGTILGGNATVTWAPDLATPSLYFS